MSKEKDEKVEETMDIKNEEIKDEEIPEEAAEAEASEEAEATEDADGDENEVKEEKDEKDIKIAELEDKFKRLFAEFDNFRKRSETEKAGRFAEGEKTVILKILPLIDNFERALANVPEELKDNAYTTGMEMIYKSFMELLKDLGVTQIEAVGKEFDANLHNAVMHVEDEESPENTVVEEFQKGYMFGDKVIRYSMVKVAN
ncbi:MAG: nucleotide exchange factor GrpE [Eubacteriales bacterium]|nr:nucleotide exchange factor GrpE [Eubacteriales bacterium]